MQPSSEITTVESADSDRSEHTVVEEFKKRIAAGELKEAGALLKSTERLAVGARRRLEDAVVQLAMCVYVYRAMVGHLKGRNGQWSRFLKRLEMSESHARGLMNAYERCYGHAPVARLMQESETPQTSVVLISAPSVPDEAFSVFLKRAKEGPVSVSETKALIARYKTTRTAAPPAAEAVAIAGVGRVVLHPSKDADERIVSTLKTAITRWAEKLEARPATNVSTPGDTQRA